MVYPPRYGDLPMQIACLALVLCFSPANLIAQGPIPNWPEFHRKDLETWVRKTGLTFEDIDQLAETATRGKWAADDEGAGEENPSYMIENIDTKTLSARKHILFATWDSGTGHCLTVYVLKRRGSKFEKVWESAENLCTYSVLGAARTMPTRDGRIKVRFRDYAQGSRPGNNEPAILTVVVTFKWNGTTYLKLSCFRLSSLGKTAGIILRGF